MQSLICMSLDNNSLLSRNVTCAAETCKLHRVNKRNSGHYDLHSLNSFLTYFNVAVCTF